MLLKCPKCDADVEAAGDSPRHADCPHCGESIRPGHDELQTQIFASEGKPVVADDGLRTEPSPKSVPRTDDGKSSKRMQVRCPQCAAPIDTGIDDSLQDVTCPSCGSNFNLIASTETVAYQQRPNETIGHFELVEQVGVGQFGTVWKAKDKNLDRTVAVKVPRKGQLSERETEQFLREARAAAQLKHPNIVSVHEVGRFDESVYIVSDFVQGVTLSDWLTGQSLTPREAAGLCVKVGEALEHAHAKGVVHRDLKPGNIMMTADGEPHIMDFGLAKRETGEITMTTDGQVLGTPAYMSPEQARGDAHSADRRADVYSLGVVLFQLLTGELPFRGNSRMILHQVLNEDAPSPRKLNVRVPRDLETICLKCLEKEPQRRYATAGDVAEELRRFLRGEPLRARPVLPTARFVRWCKRKPILAGLSLTVIGLLVFLSVAAPLVAWQQAELRLDAERNADDARESKERADTLREQALRDRRAAERAGYRASTQALEAYENVAESRYSQARVLWNDRTGNRQQQALQFLAEAGKLAGDARQLAASLEVDPRNWKQRTDQFWIDFTPKLRSEAVRWLTQTSAQELARPPAVFFPENHAPNSKITITQPSLALSPDGNTLAVYRPPVNENASPTIAIVNTVSGVVEKTIPFELHGSKRIYEAHLAFAGDKELMILRRDRIGLFGVTTRWRVQYVDIATGKSRFVSLTGSDSRSFSSRGSMIEFSADRKWVMINTLPHSSLTEIFSTETGRRHSYVQARNDVFGMTADSKRLVMKHENGKVSVVRIGQKVWDPNKAVTILAKLNYGSYRSVPLPLSSPDGKWLAVFHTDRPYSSRRQFRLKIYDLETGRLQAERALHSVARRSANNPDIVRGFSPDGRLLAVASGEWFYLFSVPDGGLLFSRRHPEDTPNVKEKRTYYSSRVPWEPAAITFSANGARIALALKQIEPRVENGSRYALQVWDVAAGEVPVKSLAHENRVAALSYGRGKAEFVSAGADGILRAWTADGDRRWQAGYHKNDQTNAADDGFDPTGTVYLRGHPTRLDVWDAKTGRLRKRYSRDALLAVAKSRKYLAVRKPRGDGVRIYDLAGDIFVADFNWMPKSGAWTYAFSDDERHLTGRMSGKTILIGRISDGRTIVADTSDELLSRNAMFAPSGDRVVISRADLRTSAPILNLWDLKTGKRVAQYRGDKSRYFGDKNAAFSPDEQSVAFVERHRNTYNRQWVKVWRFAKPTAIAAKKKRARSTPRQLVKGGLADDDSTIGREWYYTPEIYWPAKDRVFVSGQRRDAAGNTRKYIELWDVSKRKLLATAETPNTSSNKVVLSNQRTAAVRVMAKNRRLTDIWDLTTGNRLATFDGRPSQLSRNGGFLLLTGPVRLVEMRTGREILRARGSLSKLEMRFSANDVSFLTRDYAEQATLLWQTKTATPAPGKPIKSFLRRLLKVDTRFKSLPTGIPSVEAISPDGRFLVTFGLNKTAVLQVWNLMSAKLEREIPIHPDYNRLDMSKAAPVKDLRFTADGKRLSFSVLGQVRIADFEKGKLVALLDRPSHTDLIRSVAVSRDGKLVATASRDGTVCLWHAANGRFAAMLYGFGRPTVRDAVFSSDGKLLITREHGGRIAGWKLEIDGDWKRGQSVKAVVVWQHQAQAVRLAIHPTKPIFATGHPDGMIDVRDCQTGKALKTLKAEGGGPGRMRRRGPIQGGGAITALTIAPDAERLAAVDSLGTLRLWNLATGRPIHTWSTAQGTVNAVAIAPDSGLIATAGNGTALWHVGSERPLTVFGKSNNAIRAVAFSPVGDVLATGGDDHRAHLLDLKRLRDHLQPLKLAW